MKKLLLILAVWLSVPAYAQNYQCLQAGVKHFFTNAYGYLRGIRIDSVKSYPDSTVYYPFHTPRGKLEGMLGGYIATLDSNGGSWLGKKVIQLNDGTFLFDNLWGDTVVIKSRANVSDSWVLYSDTSSLYYLATVNGIDTMTVWGTLDSVKKIVITARNGSGIVAAEPVNNFELLLSKNNGFAQVCDLYTFPYHKPDSVWRTGLDYYLDHSLSTPHHFNYIAPNVDNSIYKPVIIINPTLDQFYQVNIGDVYEWKTAVNLGSVSDYRVDTIINKSVSAGKTTFTYRGKYARYDWAYLHTYIIYPDSGTYTFNNETYIFDTTKMPEGSPSPGYCNYYFSHDTTYCTQGPAFSNGWRFIWGSDGETATYKSGLASVYRFISHEQEGYNVNLIYYDKSGSTCGTYYFPAGIPAAVNNIIIGDDSQIYPNPATTQITITSPNNITNITITNILGQTICTQNHNSEKVEIDVSHLPPGIYLIRINNTEIRKFVKQ